MKKVKGVKGRIDTFQAIAFSKAIFSLKAKKSFWWPKFSRTQDNPIPHGSFISGKEAFFVIEGNYLFIQSEPWVSAAKNFQYSIFVDLPDKILRGRLYTRHQKGGFSMDLIKEKIENVDIPNAALIRETKSLANVIYIEDSNANEASIIELQSGSTQTENYDFKAPKNINNGPGNFLIKVIIFVKLDFESLSHIV